MFHMSLFETKAAAVCGDVLVFYVDFETTGLDVLAAEYLASHAGQPAQLAK
jgi:hypothetical protein